MDLYILLGVEREATLEDIKRAYRRLARRFHPDINPGDRMAAQRFRQIAEAYETLSDPDRRRRYDAVGMTSEPPLESSFGFEGFDFSITVNTSSAPTFGDLFGDALQQRAEAPQAVPERGADLHQVVALTFEEAVRGTSRSVTITRQESCAACRGAGRLPGAESRCTSCHGSGVLKSVRGHMVFSKPCSQCGGSGVKTDIRCPACGGRRVDMRSETLLIEVPPGVADGARVRLAGKGHAGVGGGQPGDLLVAVRVEPHPLFTRDGADLHLVVPVAIHEAALGARVDVPSLDGQARVRIPPGTQSGQRFRLRERGLPTRDGRRGDLIVEIRMMLPKVLDERSKELLREFGQINTEDVRAEIHQSKGQGG
jgi:molecular chaperone DnaJ